MSTNTEIREEKKEVGILGKMFDLALYALDVVGGMVICLVAFGMLLLLMQNPEKNLLFLVLVGIAFLASAYHTITCIIKRTNKSSTQEKQ